MKGPIVNHRENYVVLIVDDDELLCAATEQILITAGMKTIIAHDGREGFACFLKSKPDVVVADLRMPLMDGLELLKKIKETGSTAPVIMSTGDPDMKSVIGALQDGAYDYLLKPYDFEVLLQKIHSALEKTRLARENIILSEIVSLYTVTSKLAATHNLDSLLDVIFRYGFELTGSRNGALFLRSGTEGELHYVRQRGRTPLYESHDDPDAIRTAAAQSCLLSGKPFVVERGIVKRVVENSPYKVPDFGQVHSLIAMPLLVDKAAIGVFIVEREISQPVFSELDYNRLEILVSQAGIAVNNAELCASLKEKIEELKLVGAFSENLMGRLDKYDLVRSLFEKIREHCAADVIGFLLVHGDRHEFLYWMKSPAGAADVQKICRNVIDYFNGSSLLKATQGNVSMKQLVNQRKQGGEILKMPLGYRFFVPVLWEGTAIGTFFVGASVKRARNVESEPLVSGLVNQVRIALINVRLYDDMKENYLKTIKALAAAVDAKDNYTRGHSEKVMEIAEELAGEMKVFDARRVAVIRDAALLHDIGKIGIPGTILNKTGALTFDEFDGVVKKHSVLGANIVREVPFLNDLYKLILHHHEHFDGSGYPAGLKGEAIPLEARLLHLADAFEAMTSDRPYRSSLGNKEAVRRIVADSGKHFDPAIVSVFLKVLERKGLLQENVIEDVPV
jgi:putative nucleotidyltransferase with HDIG domain